MAKVAAKKIKKEKELDFEMPTGSPRTWTVEQRRNALAYLRKDTKSDHRIYGKDFQEILVPYGHFIFDKVLRLGGIARGVLTVLVVGLAAERQFFYCHIV